MSDTENMREITVLDVLRPYEQQLDKLPDEKPLKAKLIETPIGSMLAISNEKTIVFLMFTASRHFDRQMKFLIKSQSKAIIAEDVKPLQSLDKEIKAYFDGNLTEFNTPYENNQDDSEFTREVLDELKKVKYGSTTTFGELAKKVGKPNGVQPVANACSRNSMSLIIPCHRIMSASKKTGGYSCVHRRNWLLGHEKSHSQKQ